MLNDDDAHRNAKAVVIHPWWHRVAYGVMFLILAAFTFMVLNDLIGRVNTAEERVDRADQRTDTTLQAVEALNAQIKGLGATPVVTPSDLPTAAQDGRDGAAGPSGSPGATGSPGAAGAAGSVGATGQTGARGLAGEPGASGSPGPSGSNGTNGEPGVKGATGDPGPKGATGDPGPKGDTGATGEQGPQGIQGVQGQTGPAPASFTFSIPLVGSYTCTDPDGDGAYDCTPDAAAPVNPRTTKIVRSN